MSITSKIGSCNMYIILLSLVPNRLSCPLKVTCASATPAVDTTYTHEYKHYSDGDSKQEQAYGYPCNNVVSQAQPICEVVLAICVVFHGGCVGTRGRGAITVATPDMSQNWRHKYFFRYLNFEWKDGVACVVCEKLNSHV